MWYKIVFRVKINDDDKTILHRIRHFIFSLILDFALEDYELSFEKEEVQNVWENSYANFYCVCIAQYFSFGFYSHFRIHCKRIIKEV